MISARLVWANLRWRPVRSLLALAATTIAFMLHGLALGIAEGFRLAAIERGIQTQPATWLLAMGISALGMVLILLVTTSAMAQSVRARVHQLALMKAIGFSHTRMLALLVAEAAVPNFAGAALGLVGSKVLFAAVAAAQPVLAVVPAPVITAPTIVVAFALALLVALVGTTIPARRIARMDVSVLMQGSLPMAGSRHRGEDDTAARDVTDGQAVGAWSEWRVNRTIDLRLIRQIAVATRIGLATLHSRLKGVLLMVGSVAATVFVLLFVLSAGEGIRVGLLGSADSSRIVLRSNSAFMLNDGRTPEGLAALVSEAPGIAQSTDGGSLVETEIFSMVTQLARRDSKKSGYTMLVGVEPQWRDMMAPKFRFVSGRMPRPGHREVIAGVFAAGMFSGLDDGVVQHIGQPWRVVGTFTTGGGWWDGYLVGDLADVKAAIESLGEGANRGPADEFRSGSAVRVRLGSPQAFDQFRSSIALQLPGSVVVERETDYYREYWRRSRSGLPA